MLRRTPLRRRGRATARTRRYQAYMKSPEWKEKRKRILERDSYQCLMCGEEATEVHHLRYARFGNELETDLISVCRECNQAARQKSIWHHMMGTKDL